jgi:hypothetical protein
MRIERKKMEVEEDIMEKMWKMVEEEKIKGKKGELWRRREKIKVEVVEVNEGWKKLIGI